MCKTKIINSCNKATENEININEVHTIVIEDDKSRLISVLEKFKDSFIMNFEHYEVHYEVRAS